MVFDFNSYVAVVGGMLSIGRVPRRGGLGKVGYLCQSCISGSLAESMDSKSAKGVEGGVIHVDTGDGLISMGNHNPRRHVGYGRMR